MDKEQLKKELRRDEGLRLEVYNCTNGFRTIGYGHMINKFPSIKRCTLEEAEEWLESDIRDSMMIADVFLRPDTLESLDSVRQRVIVNMTFNLGFRIMGFNRFLAAIKHKQWKAAADHGLDSLWARQVGQRAIRLMRMMETGEDERV